MDNPSQDRPVQNNPTSSSVPNDQVSGYSNQTPTTSSDDLFPPSSPGSTVRAMVGGRLITTTLGVFLLVAGLAAGVVLVTQRQLLEQKATVLYRTELPCSNGAVQSGQYFCNGSTSCLLCKNGVNYAADRSLCPSPCYYATPQNLANPCYNSQVDADYGQTYVGDCPFSKNGCGQSVMATLLCEKKGSSLNPVEINQQFYTGQSTCTGTTPTQHLNALKAAGINFTTPSIPINTSNIKNLVNNGNKVMILCKVNSIDHWTLADKVVNGKVVLSDPLFGDGNILGETEKIDLNTCQSMISISK